MSGGQRAQKGFKSLCVGLPKRRKLEDDRAKLRFQPVYPLEEPPDPDLGVLQFLHVCEKPASLRGETESLWSRVAPFLQSAFEREAIERIVEFNRIEMLGVKLQQFGSRKLLRIERAMPMAIVPPRRTDVNCA